ncbi:MAG: ATP-binding protein [Verrucomicrobia bacterium]|nr:ATP-binding protein [Verrucomicrobiota bacterium]
MHGYIQRIAGDQVVAALKRSPAVAILGPRQCGKSTLARRILTGRDAVHLDLQARADLAKLSEPELFLEQHRSRTVCLDEIQRLPEFFSILRSEIDRDRRPGRFLILGSASRDLIRQSSETLAGRIAYIDLTPFLLPEVAIATPTNTLWNRGGFPDSLLAADDAQSAAWRRDFTQTFLERDIPALGFSIPIPVMHRLWRLLAHYHGQTINYSKLAEASELSVQALKKYLALLEQTYMLRLLPPHGGNLKKRLVKAPKLYIRDAGLLHDLLDIESFDQLLGHAVVGASWEGHAMENIIACMPRWRPSFVRTSNGAEVDLVLERGSQLRLYEFKASKAPKPSRGFHELIGDLKPATASIVAPVDASFDAGRHVRVQSLSDACADGRNRASA